MSVSRVRKAIQSAQLPDSSAGAKITRGELQKIWQTAIAPEGGDLPGKPLSVAEAREIESLLGTQLTWSARRLLKKRIQKLPGLTAPDDSGLGGAQPLTSTGGPRAVFLNDATWPVPRSDISGQPNILDLEEGFYRIALQVSQSNQHEGQSDILSGLSNAQKSKLAGYAIAYAKKSRSAAGGQLQGLSADDTSQLRSSAFTMLWAMGKSVTSSAQLKNQIHDALIKIADQEPDKWLGKHMARMLDRDDYRSTLSEVQQAECKDVFAAHHPQKFDVGNILDAEGYISWEHVCGRGEGFYKSFVANLKKEKIGGAKFTKTASSWRNTSFELKFDPARGDNGRVKGIRIDVREFNDDMFDTVGKKKGFSYGGHSNIGQNQEASLENALLKGLKASSPQLALLDLCAGLDNLDDNLETLGDIEVLTTFGSSFFWKGKVTGEDGTQFDGVTRSEGLECLSALFDCLSREQDYEQMRQAISKEIYRHTHERNPNVVFPTLKDYREVRWMHLDGDNDGRMDANDVLYQFGLKVAAGDSAHEFAFKNSGTVDALYGDALKNAVLNLNVATHYNATTNSNTGGVEHRFLADGYFDGSHSTDYIKISEGQNHDGKPTFNVKVNSRLAHTSREALEALTAYQGFVWLADENKVHGVSEVDRKLMGLTIAIFRLTNYGPGRSDDQRIWKQMLQALRLPSDLPFGPLASLVDAEHHDYAGNLTIVNKYKERLSESALNALESPNVGRPGNGPPIA